MDNLWYIDVPVMGLVSLFVLLWVVSLVWGRRNNEEDNNKLVQTMEEGSHFLNKKEPAMNIMVDIETMGRSPDGAIMSIGAVAFNRKISHTFYTNISLQSNLECGMEIHPDTVMWWMQQSKEAQESLLNPMPIDLNKALFLFKDWLLSHMGKKASIWANGVMFDLVILRSAFVKCGISIPWSFKQECCLRSIRKVATIVQLNYSDYFTKESHNPMPHNALSDALVQTRFLLDFNRRIGEKMGRTQ